jgi:UDP-glucose 4-epimerase
MNISGNKFLVTGGAGFIGTHLAERLLGRGGKIALFDNLRRDSLSGMKGLAEHPDVHFVRGDVLNRDEVARAMEGCSTVVHMAAIAGVSSYYREPARTLRVNLVGTLNVLECAREMGVRKVVDFSTSEVYGPDAFDVSEESSHVIGPLSDYRWTYATSKLASEQLTLRFGEEYGFKAYTVRPFNIYGPRQTGEGAISNFCRAAATGEPIEVYGDGTPVRSWCYISDLVDALMVLAEDGPIESGAFNIGNPRETYSTLGLANLFRRVIGKDVPITFKEMDRTEVRVRVPNIGKARRLLGFAPRVGLEEGIEKTYRWFTEKA